MKTAAMNRKGVIRMIMLGMAALWLRNEACAIDVPVAGTEAWPVILLQGGSQPETADATKRVCVGQIASSEGVEYATQEATQAVAAHPGFGQWKVSFRYSLPEGMKAGEYGFGAYWKQGGDPEACEQKFEVWAGPDETKLELRATHLLKPAGWEYAWRKGGLQTFKPEDKVIEIRNSGSGHDAKVFGAFMLVPTQR
jgi:hypothetical protein